MKTIKIFFLLFFLLIGFTANAGKPHHKNHRNDVHHSGQIHKVKNGHHNGPVGAPLDGGLLSILGVGGIAYYVARRRKKRLES